MVLEDAGLALVARVIAPATVGPADVAASSPPYALWSRQCATVGA